MPKRPMSGWAGRICLWIKARHGGEGTGRSLSGEVERKTPVLGALGGMSEARTRENGVDMKPEASGAIRGVLLDLGGVAYVGDETLPGAVDAVARLRGAGLAVCFITNTTRTPRRAFLDKIRRLGLSVEADELFMPAIAARRLLEARGLCPLLLVHPALVEDFAGLPAAGPPAVVVGDAAGGFTYEALNAAFRLLVEEQAEFLALARNRSFKDDDNRLSLDAGPFVAALEYATGRAAAVFGKPSAEFFGAARESLGCIAAEAVMVGDDVEADIAGALAAGIAGVLVRTGKYCAGDEDRIDPPPGAVVADLAEAADWILTRSGAR